MYVAVKLLKVRLVNTGMFPPNVQHEGEQTVFRAQK